MRKYYSCIFYYLMLSILSFYSCNKSENNPTSPEEIQPPQLDSPVKEEVEVNTPVLFKWQKSSNAETYRIQVTQQLGGIGKFAVLWCDTSGLIDNSLEFSDLNNSTEYFWRVNSSSGNNTSKWSDEGSFTTATAAPCPGIPTITYDGKVYHTVKIGSQCWLKENLNVGSMINNYQNSNDNGIIEKYCYNNDPNNCDTYGGLYQWNEAMQYSIQEKSPGICPNGWHIPSKLEWEKLQSIVYKYCGNSLKSVGQGSGIYAGTNTSGFSALFPGYRYYDQAVIDFNWLGYYSRIWSSTETDLNNATFFDILSYDNEISFSSFEKGSGYSIRCIKD